MRESDRHTFKGHKYKKFCRLDSFKQTKNIFIK